VSVCIAEVARIQGIRDWRTIMRVHYAIAVVAIVLIGFGLKLTFFPAPPAEAVVLPVAAMDVFQIQQNSKNLPTQKIHDMTFVFTESD
jgi:hypothetical protein